MQLCLCWDSLHIVVSWSKASQAFKEQGPAVCQVITTSFLYFSRYNHRLSGTASSTSPNFVWDICGRRHIYSFPLSLFQPDRWELYYVLVICRAKEREARETERELRRQGKVISETLPPSCCYHVSLSGKFSNAVQKYYVNRLLGLILTER